MFHILVVDDDKSTRLLLRAVLEAENYTVTAACNGAEALESWTGSMWIWWCWIL